MGIIASETPPQGPWASVAARPDREDVAQTAQHELLAEFSRARIPHCGSELRRHNNNAHHDVQIRNER